MASVDRSRVSSTFKKESLEGTHICSLETLKSLRDLQDQIYTSELSPLILIHSDGNNMLNVLRTQSHPLAENAAFQISTTENASTTKLVDDLFLENTREGLASLSVAPSIIAMHRQCNVKLSGGSAWDAALFAPPVGEIQNWSKLQKDLSDSVRVLVNHNARVAVQFDETFKTVDSQKTITQIFCHVPSKSISANKNRVMLGAVRGAYEATYRAARKFGNSRLFLILLGKDEGYDVADIASELVRAHKNFSSNTLIKVYVVCDTVDDETVVSTAAETAGIDVTTVAAKTLSNVFDEFVSSYVGGEYVPEARRIPHVHQYVHTPIFKVCPICGLAVSRYKTSMLKYRLVYVCRIKNFKVVFNRDQEKNRQQAAEQITAILAPVQKLLKHFDPRISVDDLKTTVLAIWDDMPKPTEQLIKAAIFYYLRKKESIAQMIAGDAYGPYVAFLSYTVGEDYERTNEIYYKRTRVSMMLAAIVRNLFYATWRIYIDEEEREKAIEVAIQILGDIYDDAVLFKMPGINLMDVVFAVIGYGIKTNKITRLTRDPLVKIPFTRILTWINSHTENSPMVNNMMIKLSEFYA